MANAQVHALVLAVGEGEKHLAQSWEYVATLPNNRAILKLPS